MRMTWRRAARGILLVGWCGLSAFAWCSLSAVAWCTLAGVASATEPDGDPVSHEQRIRELEDKVTTATQVLGALRTELDALKREAGMSSSSSAGPGTGLLRADFIGDSDGVPLYRVQATPSSPGAATPSTPSAPSDADLDQGAPAEQEAPVFTPAFLRDARALLLPRNRLEVEPGVGFTQFTRNSLNIRGLDIINSIFVGTIEVQKLKRRSILPYLQLRYGILDDLQMGVRVAGASIDETLEFPPDVQALPARARTVGRSALGLGDLEADIAWNALHESGWIPDVIFTGLVKTTTGNGPFDVGVSEAATGTGFWGARAGFTVVKVSDPATLFLNASYFWQIADRVQGVTVDPPDSIDIGAGLGYALNPVLSLTSRFEARFVNDLKIDGTKVDGSSQVIALFSNGIAYSYSRTGSFQVSVGFGLTTDSPDFELNFSLPFVFDLPKWWD
jgi:hypothetical protein